MNWCLLCEKEQFVVQRIRLTDATVSYLKNIKNMVRKCFRYQLQQNNNS